MKKNGMPEIQINKPGEGFKASLRSRVAVALVLVAIMVPCVFLGGWFFFSLGTVVALIAIWELSASTGKKFGWWVYALSYIVSLSYIFWFAVRNNLIEQFNPSGLLPPADNFNGIDVSVIGMATALCAFFATAILDKNFSFADAAHFFILTFLLGVGIQSAFFLRFSPAQYFAKYDPSYVDDSIFKYLFSTFFMIFAVGGACVNDIFAYFGGIFFGKHKLNERVSPKKTWEGFAIGAIITAALLMGFGFGMAALGHPILPFFTMENWFWIVIFSFVVPIVADLGDLAFSLIKRHYGIKDFGNILKGHGGVLDRFDSVIFVAIVLSSMIITIEGFGLWIK
ncbi:MAG: phosphatidate cytidylyltransferase [Bacilli bacterium]|nr:phosphatidate cytidylyltransferase [Bacilli bacterium]